MSENLLKKYGQPLVYRVINPLIELLVRWKVKPNTITTIGLVINTFATVIFIFGGEYGEGVMIVHGKPAGYYNLVSASFGFQLGVQERSVIILFMTPQALEQFRATAGWKVGVDGSIAIITVGAGGSIDSSKITSPVVGFILDPKGLMYNLTLEGSKMTRISR